MDYTTGAVSSTFTPEELISLFSELDSEADLTAFLVGNLFSEDLRFSHYNLLLEKIVECSKEFDGVIISHGTDTMHYTSAALQYALKGLNVPVVLVGAQRSSDRASSDAFLNLGAAISFISYNKGLREAGEASFNRVGICMHETIDDSSFLILDGINAKKLHSSRRDAFEQVNFLPVCRILADLSVERLRGELFSVADVGGAVSCELYDEGLKVGVFMAHPHLCAEEIEMLRVYDGVVFANTGLGNLGITGFDSCSRVNEKNAVALRELVKCVPVCVSTQCVHGKVNLNVYSSGRRLQELGGVGEFFCFDD